MNTRSIRTSGNGAAPCRAAISLAGALGKLVEREIQAHTDEDDSLATIPAIIQTASNGKRTSRKTAGSRQTAASASSVRLPDEERRWFWPVEARPPSKGKTYEQ
jgi:hypothetical protein